MKLCDVPFIPKGYTTALAGWGAFLVGVGGFVTALGKFLLGDGDFELVIQMFLVMTGGLSVLGIGRKIEHST